MKCGADTAAGGEIAANSAAAPERSDAFAAPDARSFISPASDAAVDWSALIRTADALIWSLWFGGVMALFVLVTALFSAVPRATFIAAAPHLFHTFERYQLILAAASLLTTLLWRIASGSGTATAAFTLLAAATIVAVCETTLITPRIEALRLAGRTGSDAFRRLHGASMVMYVGEAVILLAAGIVLMARRRLLMARRPMRRNDLVSTGVAASHDCAPGGVKGALTC